MFLYVFFSERNNILHEKNNYIDKPFIYVFVEFVRVWKKEKEETLFLFNKDYNHKKDRRKKNLFSFLSYLWA